MELVRRSKKEQTVLARCCLPVLHVAFNLGDTESVLCCSPKSPTLRSCRGTPTAGQTTRQSLPFVFELGFRSKKAERKGHTAELPKPECTATLMFLRTDISKLIVGVHKTDPIQPFGSREHLSHFFFPTSWQK